jgi:hypothetical protein
MTFEISLQPSTPIAEFCMPMSYLHKMQSLQRRTMSYMLTIDMTVSYTYLYDKCRPLGGFMNKVRVSLRLDSSLVKSLDARKTKTKNRSDVIVELLNAAISSDTKSVSNNKSTNDIAQSTLHEQGAKASLFAMRMLELFLKMPDEKGSDVCKKAHALYKKDLRLLDLEPQPELESQEFQMG